MIDGSGRGHMQGALKAQELQRDLLIEEIQSLAQKELACLLKQGYGNLEPYEKFLEGFYSGFVEQRVLAKAETIEQC